MVGNFFFFFRNIVGKEVITRYHFSTPNSNKGFNSSKTFYTDSNGREMIKRVRDYRPFNFDPTLEPVSQNYYPVTSKITLKDEVSNLQVSILNDRAQGGASLKDGDIELMVKKLSIYIFIISRILKELFFS